MNREERVKNFMKEYEALCKKYNLSLGHEDSEGGFILDEYKEDYVDWVKCAMKQWELDAEEERRINEMADRLEKMKAKLKESIGYSNYIEGDWVYDKDGNYVRDVTEEEKKTNWAIDMLERNLRRITRQGGWI